MKKTTLTNVCMIAIAAFSCSIYPENAYARQCGKKFQQQCRKDLDKSFKENQNHSKLIINKKDSKDIANIKREYNATLDLIKNNKNIKTVTDYFDIWDYSRERGESACTPGFCAGVKGVYYFNQGNITFEEMAYIDIESGGGQKSLWDTQTGQLIFTQNDDIGYALGHIKTDCYFKNNSLINYEAKEFPLFKDDKQVVKKFDWDKRGQEFDTNGTKECNRHKQGAEKRKQDILKKSK